MRTGSSSLNFFQAVFTRVVTAISQPPPAESIEVNFENKLVDIHKSMKNNQA